MKRAAALVALVVALAAASPAAAHEPLTLHAARAAFWRWWGPTEPGDAIASLGACWRKSPRAIACRATYAEPATNDVGDQGTIDWHDQVVIRRDRAGRISVSSQLVESY